MGEKIYVTIPIDEDIFYTFSKVVKRNGKSKYETLEELMRLYIEKLSAESNSATPDVNPDDSDYVAWTAKLLQKCSDYKVGQLANFVLRRLLEKGVADDKEVEEFQKANGAITVDTLQIKFGKHVKNEFGLSFPLLITDEHRQYDRGNNFWVNPSHIAGQKFYLCSQWVENLHRKKLEGWIRKSLPIWLENTDEDSRNEMLHWIANM